MNRQSGRVLSLTYKTLPAELRLSFLGVTGSFGEGTSKIPDRWSGVRSFEAATSVDDELVLEVDPEFPVTSMFQDKLSFSESDG